MGTELRSFLQALAIEQYLAEGSASSGEHLRATVQQDSVSEPRVIGRYNLLWLIETSQLVQHCNSADPNLVGDSNDSCERGGPARQMGRVGACPRLPSTRMLYKLHLLQF